MIKDYLIKNKEIIILREGYLEMKEDSKQINKEWESTDKS